MPRLLRPVVIVPVAVVAVAAAAVPAALSFTGGDVTLTGVDDHALLDAAGLKGLHVAAGGSGVDLSALTVTVDGTPARTSRSGDSLAVALGALGDGTHTVAVNSARSFGLPALTASRSFTVDTTPPTLDVAVPTGAVRISDRVEVKGTAEKGAKVTATGGTLTVQGDSFTVRYDRPPAGAEVVATDAAGNVTTKTVTVATSYPDNIRAVHMTGAAWAYAPLKDPVIQMIKEHRINAVELDIKDEDGIVNYPSQLPLVQKTGAAAKYYDAKQVTDYLHGLGVRVIGRIVAFNDPELADYAVANGHMDWVIQQPDGSKYLYGYNKHGFTNFANSEVRKYNEDIAVEAGQAGFDDIVYDYVRRPDGNIANMRFPGIQGTPEQAIVQFVAETQKQLRPLGVSLGAAAFAQAATRPTQTAQDIPGMAKYLDVVIPMDYPSHWNPGEYGVPDMYADPYSIVNRSLKDWQKAVAGTSCKVVPWLQDEDYKGVYTAEKVEAQIKGARDDGIPGWLMWSAGATYTPAAYSPDATPAR